VILTNYVGYNSVTGLVAPIGSTKKLKKNIIHLPGDILDNFKNIESVIFQSIVDNSTSIGFIAEQLAEVHPQLPSWGKNYKYNPQTGEREGLIDDKIVPVSVDIMAVLSLTVAKVQQLEREIQELKSKLK